MYNYKESTKHYRVRVRVRVSKDDCVLGPKLDLGVRVIHSTNAPKC